jgi:hypothetical protein
MHFYPFCLAFATIAIQLASYNLIILGTFCQVAVNLLNRQLWTAKKGWSISIGIQQGTNNPSLQNKPICYKMIS